MKTTNNNSASAQADDSTNATQPQVHAPASRAKLEFLMSTPLSSNTLSYGDNLEVLRENVADEAMDLS